MGLNYQVLLKPYSEDGRTPEGQIKWLAKKGIAQNVIDQAMLFVYDELSRGKVYKDGHELDRYLLGVAQSLVSNEIQATRENLERFHETLREAWNADLNKLVELDRKKWPLWKRILFFRLTK